MSTKMPVLNDGHEEVVKTHHAKVRQAQRAIRDHEVDIVLMWGTPVKSMSSRTMYYLGRREISSMIRVRERENRHPLTGAERSRLYAMDGLCAVEGPDQPVVTVWQDRIHRPRRDPKQRGRGVHTRRPIH